MAVYQYYRGMDSAKKVILLDVFSSANSLTSPSPEPDDKTAKKLRNIDCWEDTKARSALLSTPPRSIKYEYDHDFVPIAPETVSVIQVYDMDTIDCALMFDRPLVLNMADDIYPGGWVNMGSFAQEESLFRRTNLHLTLTKDLYPLYYDEALYSPDIRVLKSSELVLYPDPVPTLDFIACPAVKYPLLTEEDELSEEDCVQLARKIRTILQVAKIHGHDTVIFGAMGCGAWQNPAKCVARVFKEVLQEYDGWLPNYVFAILKDVEYDSESEDGGSNYDVFKRVLMA